MRLPIVHGRTHYRSWDLVTLDASDFDVDGIYRLNSNDLGGLIGNIP